MPWHILLGPDFLGRLKDAPVSGPGFLKPLYKESLIRLYFVLIGFELIQLISNHNVHYLLPLKVKMIYFQNQLQIQLYAQFRSTSFRTKRLAHVERFTGSTRKIGIQL